MEQGDNFFGALDETDTFNSTVNSTVISIITVKVLDDHHILAACTPSSILEKYEHKNRT